MEVKALLTLDTPNPGVQQSGQSGARGTDSISAQGARLPWRLVGHEGSRDGSGCRAHPEHHSQEPQPHRLPSGPHNSPAPPALGVCLWILGAAEGAEKARAPVPAVPSLPCGDSLLKPISSLSARDAGCSEEAQSGQVAWMGERRLGLK